MLIVMQSRATEREINNVCGAIHRLGWQARPLPGGTRTAIGIVGNDNPVDPARFEGMAGVLEVIRVTAPYKLVSREWQAHGTIVTVAPDLQGGVAIGGDNCVIIAGPCAVESEEQLMKTAAYVAAAGVRVLRAGAFKPRTSPYDFQGLGEQGLKLLRQARQTHGLAIVTEAMDQAGADLVAEYADVIQIGARNMQNYTLLRHIGRLRKPVLLKRGPSSTLKEWLLAAEYLLAEGNTQVMLCERGLRSFDTATRNLLDLSAVPLIRQLSHLPVLVDPSHGTGRRELVLAMSRAAVAAGAHGLLVETHPQPEQALSDGAQSLYPEQLTQLVRQSQALQAALNAVA
jgi:3-deoxy-7-phosphoheptulonate synthase